MNQSERWQATKELSQRLHPEFVHLSALSRLGYLRSQFTADEHSTLEGNGEPVRGGHIDSVVGDITNYLADIKHF